MRLRMLLALGLMAVAGGGCRKHRRAETGDATGQGGKAPTASVTPKQIDGPSATGPSAVTFDVDEKSGRPRVTLVLRLDYFPEPKTGGVNLPACYKPFPGDFALGYVTCDCKVESRVSLLAKNIAQDCYTDSRAPRVAATEPLTLKDCRQAVAAVAQFEPKLRVDAEVRDVN